MKLKSGFKLRNVCGEYVLLAEGAEVINFNKMLAMNESAAYLYRRTEENNGEFTPETLAQYLLEEYEVSEEVATKEATVLADKWLQAGICD